jgi:hypothetical protein
MRELVSIFRSVFVQLNLRDLPVVSTSCVALSLPALPSLKLCTARSSIINVYYNLTKLLSSSVVLVSLHVPHLVLTVD